MHISIVITVINFQCTSELAKAMLHHTHGLDQADVKLSRIFLSFLVTVNSKLAFLKFMRTG